MLITVFVSVIVKAICGDEAPSDLTLSLISWITCVALGLYLNTVAQ